jgi:hypothetical protein
MHLVETPDQRLVASVVAILIGGILIFLEGVVLVASSVELNVLAAPSGANVASLGGLGIVLGLMLIGMAAYLWFEPAMRRAETGIISILLGAVSLLTGGGFLLGMGLCVAGGLIAVALPKGPHYELVPSDVEPCSKCRSLNRSSARNCAYCGEPLD